MEFYRTTESFSVYREQLRQLLVKKAVSYGNFQLQSGLKSNYRINIEDALTGARERALAASFFLNKLPENTCAVGGLETGADELGKHIKLLTGGKVQNFKVFKVPKPSIYSCDQPVFLETPIDLYGKKIAIIDDVSTTGQSLLRAAYQAELMGAEVLSFISLVNRGNQSLSNILSAGYHTYEYIFNENELEINA